MNTKTFQDSHWVSHAIDASLEVACTARIPSLTTRLESEVDFIWNTAKRSHPALFNGRVFTADSISPECISGYWTEFRRVFAQMKAPHLFEELQLRPLAVVGVLQTKQGILVGRRTSKSIYQAGIWQTPPAGSVESRDQEDSVDLAEQILAEAEEELGLTPELVTVGSPFAAVEHPLTHIVDIGIALDCTLDLESIQSTWKNSGNQEYEALDVVPDGTREEWCQNNNILEPTRIFITKAHPSSR